MAEEKFPSPEKQLLNLIEGSKPKIDIPKPATSPAPALAGTPIPSYSINQSKAGRAGLSVISFGAWLGRFSFLKQRLKQLSKSGQLESEAISFTNRALSVAIVLCLIYFVVDIPFSLVNLKKAPKINVNFQANTKPLSASEESLLKNFSYYLDKVRQRDIFKIGSKPKIVENRDELQDKITEFTKNLKLVGISWSDDPDAMVEDLANRKTYFIKRGQSIGELEVQAIFRDKIVLRYQGIEVEIK
ncbi:MAG: hypothetical protein ABIG46_07935 [Candidatus Omnitrophota bacterium]|nr:hypothetical protein [Candidatus Omnitrophota bacterium]